MIGRGRVQGTSIVFPGPLGLPEGAEVVVHIESPPADESTAPPVGNFADLPFFGMWADRVDMPESTAWVRGERERWQTRASRSD